MRKRRMTQVVLQILSAIPARLAPKRWKEWHELLYWKMRRRAEGELQRDHYTHFYTTHFGLSPSFYEGKAVVDIGCGPRGSLEWATMASRRIGIDPLAEKYLALGADRHAMEYITSGAESIPLPDGAFDVVCSFNSLDHVESVEQSVAEIKRITRSGGSLLLLVEVNHPPTACEPHELSPRRVLDLLAPEFVAERVTIYEPAGEGIYDSILAGRALNAPGDDKAGFLSVLFTRR
ncbi:MAG: class I SAM-dependent methyltransferase [Thermoanaerobaculia bacterium]